MSNLLVPIFRLLPSRDLPYIPIRSLQAPVARTPVKLQPRRTHHWPRPLRTDTNQMSS